MSATIVGMDRAWNACDNCGLASTSILTKTRRPAYSVTTRSRMGDNCLQGSHHVAHRSTMTGTVFDSSMYWAKVASVASTMSWSATEAGTGAGADPAMGVGGITESSREVIPWPPS